MRFRFHPPWARKHWELINPRKCFKLPYQRSGIDFVCLSRVGPCWCPRAGGRTEESQVLQGGTDPSRAQGCALWSVPSLLCQCWLPQWSVSTATLAEPFPSSSCSGSSSKHHHSKGGMRDLCQEAKHWLIGLRMIPFFYDWLGNYSNCIPCRLCI